MVKNYACRLMGTAEILLGGGFIYLGSGNASDALNFFNGVGAGLGAAGVATFLIPEIDRFSNYYRDLRRRSEKEGPSFSYD
ncbi:MAG: hypothetical protein HYU56_02865 [Candidatus Aenigmarchaeota archaeon]|nr:hypothetical protein [Candidatus Aenigmarchaeota archaeon]